MALNVVTSQLSESLSYLIPRRQKDFDYLKRVHLSRTHFLNVLLIQEYHHEHHMSVSKRHERLQRWWVLGMSIGKLIEMNNHATMVRASMQMIEEYEHWLASNTHHTKETTTASAPVSHTASAVPLPGMSPASPSHAMSSTQLLVTGTALLTSPHHVPSFPFGFHVIQPVPLHTILTPDTSAPTKLTRVGKSVVYEYLQLSGYDRHVTDMSYVIIVTSLCSVLHVLYQRFLTSGTGTGVTSPSPGGVANLGVSTSSISPSSSAQHDNIVKLDKRIKQLVVDCIAEDLLLTARRMLEEERWNCFNMTLLDSSVDSHAKRFYQLDTTPEQTSYEHATL